MEEILKQLYEIRIASNEMMLQPDVTQEDKDVHQGAGEALLRLLDPKIELVDE